MGHLQVEHLFAHLVHQGFEHIEQGGVVPEKGRRDAEEVHGTAFEVPVDIDTVDGDVDVMLLFQETAFHETVRGYRLFGFLYFGALILLYTDSLKLPIRGVP